MGDFFDRWRRKLGVLTFAIALIVGGSWARSFATSDTFYVRDGWLNSSEGAVTYTWFDESQFMPIKGDDVEFDELSNRVIGCALRFIAFSVLINFEKPTLKDGIKRFVL